MGAKVILLSVILFVSSYDCFAQSAAEVALGNTLTVYTWKSPHRVGTYEGEPIFMGGLSGLDYIRGSKLEFWALTDRGPNTEATALSEEAALFPVPAFDPTILRIRLEADSINVVEELPIKKPNGLNATGLPPMLDNGGSGHLPIADAVGTPIPRDPWGIDCESIAQGIAGNDLWVGEEYGPSIWHLEKSSGRVLERYTPTPKAPEDRPIPAVFRLRNPNKGFECMTVTPDGFVVAIVQSPLDNPNKSTGEASRIHRVLCLNPKSGETKMFAYVHEAPQGKIKNSWKLGDMTAINDSEFLVIEHASKKNESVQRIWKMNIGSATPITIDTISGYTLEALADSAGLAQHSIRPVHKELFFDLIANGWDPKLQKPEGITIIDDRTIAVVNDNDFGINSKHKDGHIEASHTPSRVYVWKLAKRVF